MTLSVAPAGPGDLDAVRALLRAFVAWHRERHVCDHELIDRYFDAAAFERELTSLPGHYDPLLLATCDGEPAGCVALRRLTDEAVEMKRMYVDTPFRGHGVGRALTEHILSAARTRGYGAVYLDTSVRQREAITLYRRFGFVDTAPYYAVSDELQEWLVFMRLAL